MNSKTQIKFDDYIFLSSSFRHTIKCRFFLFVCRLLDSNFFLVFASHILNQPHHWCETINGQDRDEDGHKIIKIFHILRPSILVLGASSWRDRIVFAVLNSSMLRYRVIQWNWCLDIDRPKLLLYLLHENPLEHNIVNITDRNGILVKKQFLLVLNI